MAAELHSPRDTTWLKKWHRSVWFCKNKSMSGSQWWMNEHSKQQLNSFCNCACSYPDFRPCLSCPPKESPTHPAADSFCSPAPVYNLITMNGQWSAGCWIQQLSDRWAGLHLKAVLSLSEYVELLQVPVAVCPVFLLAVVQWVCVC